MSKLSLPSEKFPIRAQRTLEAVLRTLSFYVVPIGIALISLLALLFWNNQYVTSGGSEMLLQVMAQSDNTLGEREALALLAKQDQLVQYDTRMSEAPLWMVFDAHNIKGDTTVIEFPSRHASEMHCWDAATFELLGKSTRGVPDRALAPAKAGFALKLEHAPMRVLCRAHFVGPARLTALEWPEDEFNLSVQQYHRKSGLLDGGMLVLSLFVLATAVINRQGLYVLFAGWLVLNLRAAALSAGWDIQWLGQIVPEAWLLPSRSLTFALYITSTLVLYQTLFRENLAATRFAVPLKIAEWLCALLLVAAVFLPYQQFLPVMWGVSVLGVLAMSLGLGKIIFTSHARVALWFAASFLVTFLSGLAEVLAAALGLRELVDIVNSVTAALAASLLAALAVAEQMRMETVRRVEAQAELQHTYEAMPVGLFTLDMTGRILSANPALQKIIGTDPVEIGGSRWMLYFAPGMWTRLHDLVCKHTEAEMEIDNHSGSRRFLVRATLARGRIEGVLQDVTEQAKATEQLRFMANNDPLTKVFNRRGIELAFDEAMAPQAGGGPVALAYVDLDRFKLINDLFGHAAGDEVLKQVCERIASMLASDQQMGRVGGDEFALVFPDTPLAQAVAICRDIVERIGGTPYRVGDKAFHVRGSIGLIEVGTDMEMKNAISAADRACREAKGGHKDGLVVYARNAAAFHEREAELNLVARLSAPNATAGMFLEMQPIMSLKTPHGSLNFEVLLRMRDEAGAVMAAGPIIAAAEKSGHAGLIDRWVLATTLDWIEQHQDGLSNTQFVCMNLSGASLNDERFVQDTIDILGRYKQVATRLCMEITESVALHDLDNTRRFIDQVRTFGVKVALDDFGAGYTSFSYLKELPADVLKIDGNFIVNINEHPANVAIVEAIVSLAVNLGMKTIAEWAEDTATVRTLARIGVDYVQGWAVARSMLPEELLKKNSSAGFIKDAQLAQLALELGAANNLPNDAVQAEPAGEPGGDDDLRQPLTDAVGAGYVSQS